MPCSEVGGNHFRLSLQKAKLKCITDRHGYKNSFKLSLICNNNEIDHQLLLILLINCESPSYNWSRCIDISQIFTPQALLSLRASHNFCIFKLWCVSLSPHLGPYLPSDLSYLIFDSLLKFFTYDGQSGPAGSKLLLLVVLAYLCYSFVNNDLNETFST